MKKIITLFTLAIIGFTGFVNAQKYGHLNAQELILAVPGYEAANTEMERYKNSKINDLKDLNQRLEKRYSEYIAIKETLPKSVQESREKEIQELQINIQKFEQDAQQKIQNKQKELMEPLLKQLQDAITKVGKDNGFTYIYDISQGVIVYYDGGTDVTQLVKAELQKNAVKTTTPKTEKTPLPKGKNTNTKP